LKEIDDESVDAVISDPPYDISFMNREWDAEETLRNDAIWKECLRILKPAGVLKAFSATRTYQRLCKTLNGLGFLEMPLESWIRGQGMPKSTDVSKQIDKQAGVEREIVGWKRGVGGQNLNDIVNNRTRIRDMEEAGGKGVGAYGTGAKQKSVTIPITAPSTPEAKLFHGYGTGLKPGWEPIVVVKKAG
jgi:site-specific DNA-methyltransferase (adenine-specific)